MARPLVPDTSAFVEAIRQSRPALFDTVLRGQAWLSAVVACELYAGTRSGDERQLLDRLVRGARNADHLLVPAVEDWTLAGTLLARRSRLYGALLPRDHLADVLIVVSAARIAGEVLTANLRHFEGWTSLARRAGLDVTVASDPGRI